MADLLRTRGYEVLAINEWVGRYELDIVAKKGRMLVVVEVRSRRDDRYGPPAATIDRDKAKHVRLAAWRYLRSRPELRGTRLRIDVAGVIFRPFSIEYYEDVL